MSNDEIEEICLKYNIGNYTINSDGSIDVNQGVYLDYYELTSLPLKFNKVNGNFDCSKTGLTTLKGSPKEVGGVFYCFGNKLTSLKGGPEHVGNSFYCYDNKLTDLKGSPKWVGGDFYCNNNKLTSLESGPEIIKNGIYSAQQNNLYHLYGLKTKGYNYIYLNGNPVSNVFINKINKYGVNEFDQRLVRYFNSAKIIEKKNNEYSVNIKRLQYIQTMFDIKIDTIKISKYYDIIYTR